mmetsp:Transcript_72706/g.210513  ORF Transcript_72706/g.210513 Transcript_72706/m.210513 type:complete len:310 (-) Transcript_72706:845-1774(-)
MRHLLAQGEHDVHQVGEEEKKTRPSRQGATATSVDQDDRREGDGTLERRREQVVDPHREGAADNKHRLNRPWDGERKEDILDIGAQGVRHRHGGLALFGNTHPGKDVRKGGARRRDREAQDIVGDAEVRMDPITSLHYRPSEDRQPEHAHDERHRVQVLQLGVVHVWYRPCDEPLHGKLQPIGPLLEEVHTTLRIRSIDVPPALLRKLIPDRRDPSVHHGDLGRAQLDRDEFPEVRVVLVHVQVEVHLVGGRPFAIEDVLQGDDLPRRVLEACCVVRRRHTRRLALQLLQGVELIQERLPEAIERAVSR